MNREQRGEREQDPDGPEVAAGRDRPDDDQEETDAARDQAVELESGTTAAPHSGGRLHLCRSVASEEARRKQFPARGERTGEVQREQQGGAAGRHEEQRLGERVDMPPEDVGILHPPVVDREPDHPQRRPEDAEQGHGKGRADEESKDEIRLRLPEAGVPHRRHHSSPEPCSSGPRPRGFESSFQQAIRESYLGRREQSDHRAEPDQERYHQWCDREHHDQEPTGEEEGCPDRAQGNRRVSRNSSPR
jgi:hypothetical protein